MAGVLGVSSRKNPFGDNIRSPTTQFNGLKITSCLTGFVTSDTLELAITFGSGAIKLLRVMDNFRFAVFEDTNERRTMMDPSLLNILSVLFPTLPCSCNGMLSSFHFVSLLVSRSSLLVSGMNRKAMTAACRSKY